MITGLTLTIFQSTLPRGERHTTSNTGVTNTTISIHTPTRGATLMNKYKLNKLYISIHTPTRGATGFKPSFENKIFYFNPHSHEGSDKSYTVKGKLWFISIHTPTRGATSFNLAARFHASISIHTPTRGAT